MKAVLVTNGGNTSGKYRGPVLQELCSQQKSCEMRGVSMAYTSWGAAWGRLMAAHSVLKCHHL